MSSDDKKVKQLVEKVEKVAPKKASKPKSAPKKAEKVAPPKEKVAPTLEEQMAALTLQMEQRDKAEQEAEKSKQVEARKEKVKAGAEKLKEDWEMLDDDDDFLRSVADEMLALKEKIAELEAGASVKATGGKSAGGKPAKVLCCVAKCGSSKLEEDEEKADTLEKYGVNYGKFSQCGGKAMAEKVECRGKMFNICSKCFASKKGLDGGKQTEPQDEWWCDDTGAITEWRFPRWASKSKAQMNSFKAQCRNYPERTSHYGSTPKLAFKGWMADGHESDSSDDEE